MITKRNRFHGHRSLNHVYQKGRAVRGEFVSLKVAENHKNDYRLAVVVSKKVSKSAVKRNRIRRRIYEAARLYRKQSESDWRKDIIISVFDERLASMPAEKLSKSIVSLFQKAGL